MIGDNGNNDETELDDDENLDEESSSEDTMPDEDKMPDIGGDTVIDVSGELEAIVLKLDKEDPDEAAHKREVREKLDKLAEKRDKDLDSTFNFNLDDEL